MTEKSTKRKAIGFRVSEPVYNEFTANHEKRKIAGEITTSTSMASAFEMLMIKDNAARSGVQG